MRGDLIETFKIICGISNYGIDFFQDFFSQIKFTIKTDVKN